SFQITGGHCYRFRVVRKTRNVAIARRSAVVRILWRDSAGNPVQMSDAPVKGYLTGYTGTAEAEHPLDGATDSAGWTEVACDYCAPQKAAQAVVELHLMWAPGGEVRWSDVSVTELPKLPERKVRLGTIHF